MLVDLDIDCSKLNPRMKIFYEVIDRNCLPLRVAQGIYVGGPNLDSLLDNLGLLKTRYPFSPAWQPGWSDLTPQERNDILVAHYSDPNQPEDYGVCDDYKQILERWPDITSSDRSFVIGLYKVVKSEQPARGGWRWHKWGPYIGTKEPKYEYIRDEGRDIKLVYCFHVLEVKT